MFDWYWHLRLWFWWNFVVKQDEFSNELNYWEMRRKYVGKVNYSVDVLNYLIVKQRNIAHDLDNGKDITDIPRKMIEWARI